MSCLPAGCGSAKHAHAYVESGSGETVVLLHGSAGSSALWRKTTEALGQLYRVVAPDLIGYGKSAAWPHGRDFAIEAETRALTPLLPCCAPYHLVGYSYGGVVALALALENPARVRTITLIEPVSFTVLRQKPTEPAFSALVRVRGQFEAALNAEDRTAGLREFLEFWGGANAWNGLPDAAQVALLAVADKIVLDWRAAFAFEPSRVGLRHLGSRTLLVSGEATPEPMEQLVAALHAAMPGSTRLVVRGANHLVPVTHGEEVRHAILGHLHADAERRLR
jgi:pimeloyl-ACP methyl ester carboxylesterase